MSNHRAACCCTEILCPEFKECAPNEVLLPCITLSSEYTLTSSAGQLYRYSIDIELHNVALAFDKSTGCYTSYAGTIDVQYTSELCSVFGTGNYNAADGHCCPSCATRCCGTSQTISVVNQAVGSAMTICCTNPCLANPPLLKLEFSASFNATITDCYNATVAAGCCGSQVCDTPYAGTLGIAFRAWTNVSCDATQWFRCRTVDLNWGRLNGSDYQWPARLTTNICGTGYQFEYPTCTVDPVTLQFNCAKTTFGSPFTHYIVCTCATEFCRGFTCTSTLTPPTITQCCGCSLFDPYQLFCTPVQNENGRITGVVYCERLDSTFCQPSVI